jgi:hypothetical protein
MIEAELQLPNALQGNAWIQEYWLFAVSGGLTREIKFACHQIDDAGEVAERRYPRALAFAAVPDC